MVPASRPEGLSSLREADDTRRDLESSCTRLGGGAGPERRIGVRAAHGQEPCSPRHGLQHAAAAAEQDVTSVTSSFYTQADGTSSGIRPGSPIGRRVDVDGVAVNGARETPGALCASRTLRSLRTLGALRAGGTSGALRARSAFGALRTHGALLAR